MLDHPNPPPDANRPGVEPSSGLSAFVFAAMTREALEKSEEIPAPAVQCEQEPLPAQPDVNPLKNMSDKDLEKAIADKSSKSDAVSIDSSKSMYKELIERADKALPDKDFKDTISNFNLIIKALFEGKDIKEGKRELSNQPLSVDRRWALHGALVSDMGTLGQQVERRVQFANYLKSVNQFVEAKQVGQEAADKANRLIKPLAVDGKQISPIGLFQQESARLIVDRKHLPNLEKQKEAQKASETLIKLTSTILSARKG